MLAKRVAAEFLNRPNNPPQRVKLVFLFLSPELPTDEISADKVGSSKLKLAKVARDLLYGILEQDESLFDGCKAECEKQGDRFFTNPGSLWKALRKAIRDIHAGPVYILIDGIDGLKGGGSHRELIERILGLMEIRTVKIFLSSQDVPHILNNLSGNLPGGPYTKINLDTNNFVRADVKTFIGKRVDAWGWDIDLKRKVKEALLAKSEGTFLWVSLAIENLTQHSSGGGFKETLDKLPPELEKVYQGMLETVSSRGGLRVLNMIRSVALALRPLTFGELGYILTCIERRAREKQQSVNGGTSSEIQPRTEEEIRMDVQSSLGLLRATPTTVSIVHHTAIKSVFKEDSKGELSALSKTESELIVSWECFQCLHYAFGDPERFPRGNVVTSHNGSRSLSSRQDHQEAGLGETKWEVARKDPPRAVDEWPYLRYAAESWFIHARQSGEILGDGFCDNSAHNWLEYQFFETSDIIRKPWIDLCGDLKMEVLAGDQTPAHIAVTLGLTTLIEKALPDLTEVTNSNRSLLHLAAKSLSQAWRILVDKGGPSLLTVGDQEGNTPLHEGVIFGHWPMLDGLLKKFTTPEYDAYGSEINRKNNSGNTPLHLAVQFDHPDIVKFLIDNDADQTIKNEAEVTASELGEKLGRVDTPDIVQEAMEEIRVREREGITEPLQASDLMLCVWAVIFFPIVLFVTMHT